MKGISGLSDELRLLRGVESISPRKSEGISEPKAGESKVSFGDMLSQKFDELNQLGLDVDRKIQDQMEGKNANAHDTIIAIQKADVSFRLMLNVKEQLEQAYQQIIRTSIG